MLGQAPAGDRAVGISRMTGETAFSHVAAVQIVPMTLFTGGEISAEGGIDVISMTGTGRLPGVGMHRRIARVATAAQATDE